MTTSAAQSAIRLTVLMCVAESLSMTGFACYTTLLPTLMKAWGLNNSEAGLIGGVFYTGYMLAVPVLSSLTDRVDSRRIYVGACLLSAAGAAGFALLANGLWSALCFQFLIGAGLGGTYMPGLKALTDHLEGKAQSRATAFYTASFGVGSSISIVASGKNRGAVRLAMGVCTRRNRPACGGVGCHARGTQGARAERARAVAGVARFQAGRQESHDDALRARLLGAQL